jgi:hypothetical protein
MKIKLKMILLIFSLSVLVMYFPIVHQEIPDIDQLSDDQLKPFIQKAEKGYYTENQLLSGVRARCMSDAQISEFRVCINKRKAGSADKKGQNIQGPSDSRIRTASKPTIEKKRSTSL